MTEPAMTLTDARLSFGPHAALDGMSFHVRTGEMFGLVGPDGAGKTTAVRAMLGLLPLDGGTVSVLGRDPARRDRELKEAVGYLSQRFTLYGDLTVDENVEFFGEIHRVKDLRARRERLLGFTRLGRFGRWRADRLSGGMQKKLALACTWFTRRGYSSWTNRRPGWTPCPGASCGACCPSWSSPGSRCF